MHAPRIGVLALQGAFAEHIQSLAQCGIDAVEVRKAEQLRGLHGLIIPGGESTVMSKLMTEEGLMQPIQALGRAGMPLFGTCAGLIMLCTHIVEHDQQASLELLDVTVRRNAFGRQVESFCTNIFCHKPLFAEDMDKKQDATVHIPAVFIRAPLVTSVGHGVRVLARVEDSIVAVQQGNILACSFHPELTEDSTWHRWFVEKAREYAQTP